MKSKLLFIILLSALKLIGQNSFVTENYLRLNFTPKSGVSTGTENTLWMDCDQILSRYNVSISGTTTTGVRFPSQSQLTSTGGAMTLTTNSITSITNTTSASGGNITSDGGSAVTARGVCWGTSTNPTTANNVVSGGSGTGSFSSNITGLTCNTTYYVRAFGTNSTSTYYGNQQTFSTTNIPTYTLDGALNQGVMSTPATYSWTATIGGLIAFSFGRNFSCGTRDTLVITSFNGDADGDEEDVYTLKDNGVVVTSYPHKLSVSGLSDGANTPITVTTTLTVSSGYIEKCRVSYYIKNATGGIGASAYIDKGTYKQ